MSESESIYCGSKGSLVRALAEPVAPGACVKRFISDVRDNQLIFLGARCELRSKCGESTLICRDGAAIKNTL
jgi:hypothetical protein